MKISKWIIGTALMLSAPVAYAQADSCNPCSPCAVSNPCDLCDMNFCDMKFAAYVDALYWQVNRSGLYVWSESDDCHYNCPDYDWGWRIAGFASWKSWDFGIRYTSFNTSSSKSTCEEFCVKHDFDYDVLDFEVGYTCCLPCGGLTLRPFAGAKLAWIDEKAEWDHDERVKLEFDAQGLYLGLAGRWEICNYSACDRNIPIALVSRASTSILHSSFDQHYRDCGDDYKYHDECQYIPNWDLYLGLDFTFCDLCGWDAFFQVGYEVQYWGSRVFDEEFDVGHLGLGGLVLRFGASF